MNVGDNAIDFDLPGVDGNNHPLSGFKSKVLVVIFTCNHCPYAKAYQDRIMSIQKEFESHGVQIVAINPNDDENYPEDGFEKMIERSKEAGFNFPYLRDETQKVAKAYGARVTPDVFVFDENRKLRYRGRIDDNWKDPGSVKSFDLKNAINDILDEKEVEVKEAQAMGCSVKWKPENLPS